MTIFHYTNEQLIIYLIFVRNLETCNIHSVYLSKEMIKWWITNICPVVDHISAPLFSCKGTSLPLMDLISSAIFSVTETLKAPIIYCIYISSTEKDNPNTHNNTDIDLMLESHAGGNAWHITFIHTSLHQSVTIKIVFESWAVNTSMQFSRNTELKYNVGKKL